MIREGKPFVGTDQKAETKKNERDLDVVLRKRTLKGERI